MNPAPTCDHPRDSVSEKTKARHGSTLIEIMVATLLLAVLAVAGGAYLYHARATVSMQRNRLIATEIAASRMELIRMSRPVEIEPPGPGSYHVRRVGSNWVHSLEDPGDSVSMNQHEFAVRSRLEWQSTPDLGTNRCLRVTVTVEYRPDTGDTVTLSTLHTP